MDIEENQMQVKVSELTYTKSNPIVILVIKGDKLNMNKTIKGKSQDDINSTFTWNFSTDQFKDLIKYKIGIALGRTYSVKSTKPKGKGEFFLRKLKDNSSMKETVKLQMESGKDLGEWLSCLGWTTRQSHHSGPPRQNKTAKFYCRRVNLCTTDLSKQRSKTNSKPHNSLL